MAASLSGTHTSLSADLDLAAYRMHPTASGYTSLINTEADGLATPLHLGSKTFSNLALGPRGRILAAAGGRIIRLWNTMNSQRPVLLGSSLPGLTSTAESVAISPDSRWLAAGLADGMVRIWNITRPAHPAAIGTPLHVAGSSRAGVTASFDQRGHTLFVRAARKLELWNVSQPTKPTFLAALSPCGSGPIESWASSSGGRQLAMGCDDGSARLADITDPAQPQLEGRLAGSPFGDPVTTVAYSPNGRTLMTAAVADYGTYTLWNVTEPERPTSFGPVELANNGITWASFGSSDAVLATSDHCGRRPDHGRARFQPGRNTTGLDKRRLRQIEPLGPYLQVRSTRSRKPGRVQGRNLSNALRH